MSNQTMYVVLGVAIAVMIAVIAWRLSQGKPALPSVRLALPILPPSQGQKVRDHVAPIFDDMLDKEKADAVAGRLYQAYKGDSSADPVTGVGSTVKGG